MMFTALTVIGLIAAIPAAVQDSRAGERIVANTLTVSGTGEAKAVPDVAYVTVGVITEGKRAQEASQANAALTQKVMAALKKEGIADKDLQTSNYSVQPRYENRPNREPLIIGYQVSNQIRATIRKLNRIGETIDAALDSGANNIYGVSFGLDARQGPENQALVDAVSEARRKADALARAAGVKITGVAQIHEGFMQRPVPLMGNMEMMSARAAVATPVATGELSVTANVTIVYTISP